MGVCVKLISSQYYGKLLFPPLTNLATAELNSMCNRYPTECGKVRVREVRPDEKLKYDMVTRHRVECEVSNLE